MSASEETSQVTEEAKGTAESLSEKAGAQLAEQKRTIAGQFHGIANALEMTAAQLREQGQSSVADYAQQAADAANQFGHRIEGKGVSELMKELEQFGREEPMLLAGGAAALGFALTRFARSSDEERAEE